HGLCLRHAGWRRVLGGVAAVVVVLGVLYAILTLAVPWVPVGGTWIYFVPIAALGVAIGAVGRPMLQRLGSRRACLALGRCAACGYDLHETHPESDGCCRCPECGAAWRFSTDPGERFGRMERITDDLGDRHPMRRLPPPRRMLVWPVTHRGQLALAAWLMLAAGAFTLGVWVMWQPTPPAWPAALRWAKASTLPVCTLATIVIITCSVRWFELRRFAHERVLRAECPICAAALATGAETERAPQSTHCTDCGSAWHARR
ncbi:MAG: hypothetical protein AAF995_06820, partial [Planctomycetota bacterium]